MVQNFKDEHGLNDQKTKKLLKIVLEFLAQYTSSGIEEKKSEFSVVPEDITKEDAVSASIIDGRSRATSRHIS